MEIIEELEPVRRGALWRHRRLLRRATATWTRPITIRTLVFHGEQYSYQAGAGIVADSQPAAEHDEVLAKSAALLRALTLAEAGL